MVSLSRLAASAALLLAAVGPARAQLPAAEYAAHRDSLAARLGDGLLVAFGGRAPVSPAGTFAQLPAFRWLVDYHEPDAVFVMRIERGRATSWLFTMPIAVRQAFYDGARPDSAATTAATGVRVRSIGALDAVLDSLAPAVTALWTLADFQTSDYAIQDSLTRGAVWQRAFAARHPRLGARDAHPAVYQLRARKSAAELALLRTAAEISAAGHLAAMRLPNPAHEYELQAALEYEFMRRGAQRPAYGSIVGGGPRGTILHYVRNRGALATGDLVVIDAAAEYEGYAADVTRTIPVGGRFTPEARALYQIVLDAQLAAERNSQPGMSALAALDSSEAVRTRGLARLGLIEREDALLDMPWRTDCVNVPRSCRQASFWMIHGISHGIGLEVHDPAQFYTGNRTFKPGDAFTIEPGLYISPAMLDALPDTPRNRAFKAKVGDAVRRYANTGVRIEDDYIVTEQGTVRISTGVPRTIEEIEAVMRQPRTPLP
jgi:Xaa-Pro aminopeptidase